MRVYATHRGADLDGLAALMAAPLLHGPGLLVLTDPPQESARRWLEVHGERLPPLGRPGDVDPRAVDELVVVDTRRRSRLGDLAPAAGAARRVVVYDHHPDAEDDLPAHEAHVRPVGAVATLIVEALAAAGIVPDAARATLLLAGIHSDTGHFVFPRTAPDDHRAAARCLEWGARPADVGEGLREVLTVPQVALLDQLVADAFAVETPRGPVHLARASAEEYVDDAAVVVDEARAVLGARVLVALLRAGRSTHVIGRGDGDVVDLGALLGALGGGGHPGAASAVVADRTQAEVFRDVTLRLERLALASLTADDVALRDPVTAAPEETVEAVAERLNAHRINAAPVVEGSRLRGVITRQQVEGARHRGFGGSPVSEWMNVEPETVPGDTPLEDLWRRSVEGGARLLCVVDGERLTGIATRTEVSRAVLGAALPGALGEETDREVAKDLGGRLRGTLPPRLAEALRVLGEEATARGAGAFLVGGAVRDLLLGKPGRDLDVTVTTQGPGIARAAARRLQGKVRVHDRFGTATLGLGEIGEVDVATARRETYAAPARLPDVESGPMLLDLRRRDFTINAMAIDLSPGGFGRLVDPTLGRRDLKEGVVRVIHHLSFVDDPTRAYRAARFAARFGFRIGRQTAHLLDAAVRLGLPDRLSPQRRRAEWEKAAREVDPLAVFLQLDARGLLPSLGLPPLDQKKRERMARVDETLALVRAVAPDLRPDPGLTYALVWTHAEPSEVVEGAARALGYAGREREVLVGWSRRAGLLRRVLDRPDLPDSELHEALGEAPPEAVAAALALTEGEGASRHAARGYGVVRHVRRWVTGEDLIARGARPGKRLGEVLKRVFRLQLDGEMAGPEEALESAMRAWEADGD